MPTTLTNQDPSVKPYYTGKQAREILCMSLASFYRAIKEGKIPYRQINRTILVPGKFLFPQNNESQQSK